MENIAITENVNKVTPETQVQGCICTDKNIWDMVVMRINSFYTEGAAQLL